MYKIQTRAYTHIRMHGLVYVHAHCDDLNNIEHRFVLQAQFEEQKCIMCDHKKDNGNLSKIYMHTLHTIYVYVYIV